MIKVYVNKQSNFGVSTTKLKKALRDFLENEGLVSDTDVSVSIVGDIRMLKLAKNYLNEKNVLHNVLSFPSSETVGEFVEPPDNVIHLGEIVICYSKVMEEANSEGVLVDDKAIELVLHGANHLLGKHHD